MGIEVPEQYGGAGGEHLPGHARHRGAGAGGRLGRDLRGRAQHPGQQRAPALGQRRAAGALLPPHEQPTCSAPSRSRSRPAAATPSRSRRKADEGAGGWALTGRKFWITNGAEAGIFIVFANTDFSKGYKGITAFLVERGFAGFDVGKKENKLGIRASSTTELILEGCVVPDGERARPGGPGLQDRHRDAERGPDRHRRADDRRRARARSRRPRST